MFCIPIEDKDQYRFYNREVFKYELANPWLNLIAILLTPIKLVIRILLGIYTLLQHTIECIQVIIYTIVYTFYHVCIKHYYETLINISCIVLCILSLSRGENSIVCTLLLLSCILLGTLFISKYERRLISSILQPTSENKNVRILKLVYILCYISNLVIQTTTNYTFMWTMLLSCWLFLDIAYHVLFPLYLRTWCTYTKLLIRYGLFSVVASEVVNKIQHCLDENIVYKDVVCENETQCGICYEPFTQPVQLVCGHIFDKECIRTWIIHEYSKHSKADCPSCRRNLLQPTEQP